MKPTSEQVIELAEDYSEDLDEVASSEDNQGKYITYTTIYLHKPSGTFWDVSETRTNSGYWSDSEQIGDVVAFEVTKTTKMVEVVEWIVVK